MICEHVCFPERFSGLQRGRTLAMLDGRPDLGPGLGLGALRLIRFPSPASDTLETRPPPTPNKLLGRPGLLAAAEDAPGLGVVAAGEGAMAGAGAMMTSVDGRTNMPWPMAQSKYRSPWTLPSFLPLSSSSSTPTQSPAAKCVWPTKRTTPSRPSGSRTVWPGAKSDMLMAGGSPLPPRHDRFRGSSSVAASDGFRVVVVAFWSFSLALADKLVTSERVWVRRDDSVMQGLTELRHWRLTFQASQIWQKLSLACTGLFPVHLQSSIQCLAVHDRRQPVVSA